MKIPEHLNKPLLEQLADQADSDDFIVIRGTALGYGLLNDLDKRDEFIQKFLDTSKPELPGNEMARELQARAVGMLLLDQKANELLDQAKELFETVPSAWQLNFLDEFPEIEPDGAFKNSLPFDLLAIGDGWLGNLSLEYFQAIEADQLISRLNRQAILFLSGFETDQAMKLLK